MLHNVRMDYPKVLRGIMSAGDLNQAELAKRLRVTQPTISRLLKGENEPKAILHQRIESEAVRLGLEGFGDVRSEDVADFLEDEKPARRRIKVRGYVGAGGAWTLYNVAGEQELDEIDATSKDPPNAAAALIMGTSLGPLFDRWYAIYDDVRRPMTADLVGKTCVVWLSDGRCLVKKVVRNGNRFDLLSNDPSEPPIEGVDIESAAILTDVRAP